MIEASATISHMRRLQVQLTDEQFAEIAQRAEAGDRPMAAVIRELINDALDDAAQCVRWERALAAVGGGHSGLGDVSERHDDYLGEERW